MTKLIIITGKKQSGKSTLAKAILKDIDANSDKSYNSTLVTGYDEISLYKLDPYEPMFDYLLAKQYSFAAPLKQFLVSVFGLTIDQVNGSDENKNKQTKYRFKDLPLPIVKIDDLARGAKKDREDYLTARELMQVWGTNICRAFAPDCWVESTISRIKSDNPPYAIISDARFPNEIDLLKEFNPTIIRLKRDLFKSQHVSETSLDDYKFNSNSFEIDNTNISCEEKNKLAIDFLKNGISIL